MNIAIEGCLHGQLEEVYTQLQKLQKDLQIKIDLLIICGDFQALRDQTDLDYLHCPPKYKSMGSFYKYFQLSTEAPILTIFIGGNHEAVNYMRGLYFGGWVAKNIYYLGQAGSIYVKKGSTSIKITGMSGIYNHRDFQYNLKTQRIPLYGGSKISAYHIKQLEIYRLQLYSRISQMKNQQPEKYGRQDHYFDIFLSHDWPKNIALYGKTTQLYKYKPFLQKQINTGTFGSPPAERIMKLAKPSYWFSAHMHVKYPALYPHNEKQYTHFLALDKCLQKRSCLQILNFKSQRQKFDQKQLQNEYVKVYHDLTWLSVVSLTQDLENKGDVLFTYEGNNQLKLCNSKMMNEYIIKFPQYYRSLIQKVEKSQQQNVQNLIEIPFKYLGQQLKQTQYLLQLAKINKKLFIGTIFPKSYFLSQKLEDEKQHQTQKANQTEKIIVENVDDQIQLDL